MPNRLFCLLLCLMMGSPLVPAADTRLAVTLVNPDSPGNPFWDAVTRFAQEVAEDLAIDLTVVYGDANRFKTTERAVAALSGPTKPDTLLYIYQIGQGSTILSAAEERRVRSFIFNTDIPAEDQPQIGKPGERYAHWQGHLIPDDRQAGYLLADYLITQTKARTGNAKQVELISFAGSRDSTPSARRLQGLADALTQHPSVTLQQQFFAYWSLEKAEAMMPTIRQRFPKLTTIWAASDGMALGALKGLADRGIEANLVVGGIDWTKDAIQAVQEGRLAATVGGHFMDAGWSLILIYDLHHAEEAPETRVYQSRYTLITQENVKHYLRMLKPETWDDVDFRQFSRVHNPLIGRYPLSMDAITPK